MCFGVLMDNVACHSSISVTNVVMFQIYTVINLKVHTEIISLKKSVI